ncbi:MAG: nicotinamide mononucleotide transporter [Halioglobus sp.]|nr:nicotinamide mononucleotide transporter [Halioglobus sp.]
METEISTALIVEILATAANLLYVVFLIREQVICWAFGIIGSALSVYLFIDARLYSEAFLYVFFAAMGAWGWIRWHRRLLASDNPVVTWPARFHWWAVLLGSILALSLGYTMQYHTDAERPLVDAFTTVFSILATFMEITKVMEAWLYWLLINLTSVWLYHDRSLDIYAVLIALYSVLSVWGFISWRRTYRWQLETHAHVAQS